MSTVLIPVIPQAVAGLCGRCASDVDEDGYCPFCGAVTIQSAEEDDDTQDE